MAVKSLIELFEFTVQETDVDNRINMPIMNAASGIMRNATVN